MLENRAACMDRCIRFSLCATSRAVTVANSRADVPGASVIRVVYTSNNLLLTLTTRRIVNIIDVRTMEDGERGGIVSCFKRKDARYFNRDYGRFSSHVNDY